MKNTITVLLTTDELCERLKVSKYWVSRQLNKSKNPLPSIKITRRHHRFSIEKVMDWLNAGYAEL